jgi:Cu2+-exporting ATPase
VNKRGLKEPYPFGKRLTTFVVGDVDESEWNWLLAAQKAAESKTAANGESNSTIAEMLLGIRGISSAGCVRLLGSVFMEQAGAVSCRVDSNAGTIRLRWKTGEMDLVRYAAEIQKLGYFVGPVDGEDAAANCLNTLSRKLRICAAIAINAMLFALPKYLRIDIGDALFSVVDTFSLLLATASVSIGGTVFFRRAFAAIYRGNLHIYMPISIGLIIAYIGSVLVWIAGNHSFAYFDFVSILTFLLVLGRWLQEQFIENYGRRSRGPLVSPGRIVALRNGRGDEGGAESLK